MIRLGAALLICLLHSALAETQAPSISVARAGTRLVAVGAPETFTGTARIERLIEPQEPSHLTGGTVSFEPGARTAWHTHPRGQTLIVTSGVGRVQSWGDPIHVIRAGDVVSIPPRRKHWHGASPTSAMTHIGIAEHHDGTVVEWLEQVTDEQYTAAPVGAADSQTAAPAPRPRASGPLQPRLAPGLAGLTDDVLFGDVWLRPELSPRDRSLVTLSVLVATGKSGQLTGHLNRALDNGVRPIEASGLLAHLAIYSGWPNAVSALEVYDQVYAARKVEPNSLRVSSPPGPSLASDAERARLLTEELSAVAPKFAQLTNHVVFDDLWRRTDLTPRDRSLVTIAALASTGDDAQLEYYLRRGISSGLTQGQIGEALTHLAFYAGWGKATRAIEALTKIVRR